MYLPDREQTTVVATYSSQLSVCAGIRAEKEQKWFKYYTLMFLQNNFTEFIGIT